MKIYLASPLFTEHQRWLIREIAKRWRKKDVEVYVPMEHQVDNAWGMNNKQWGETVFLEDIRAINDCDVVFVLNYGLYSDSGTAWECGYAYAKGKTVMNILVGGTEQQYSLMMLNGSTAVLDSSWNIADLDKYDQT